MTGWMVLALVAARNAGLMEASELDGAFDGALSFVDEVTERSSGRVGYTRNGKSSMRYPYNEHYPREHGEAMTAVGLLIRLLHGETAESEPILALHARLLTNKPPVWADDFARDMYYWFFGSEALFRFGAEAWRVWDRALQLVMDTGMRKEGHLAGSWDPVDVWGVRGGRVYSTAMMVDPPGFLGHRG